MRAAVLAGALALLIAGSDLSLTPLSVTASAQTDALPAPGFHHMRQGDRPLVSTRGHLADHIALSVANLDAWVAKLRGEGVKAGPGSNLALEPYRLGDTRAIMVEGPGHEAIELVEVR